MNNNNYKILLDEYELLSNSLNSIFKNVNIDIKNILTYKNIKTRNCKISFSDTLLYKFLYAYKDYSKQQVVSKLNYDNETSIDRTTYHKKDLMIPEHFYKNLFYKVRNLYDQYFKSKNEYNLIAVDGTYNNTNINNQKGKLETCLNMGYYHIDECLPIDITFCNQENKNKEILQLKKYINNENLKHINNVILVLDRAYFSYELFNFLNTHNFNYVIRIKNNCLLINDEKLIKSKIIEFQKIRIINYEDYIDITKKDKEGNDVKLKQKIKCCVITNLNKDKYNDNDIKKVYLSRWDIEVFFKFLKSNFKFSNLREHNNDKNRNVEQYNKLYYLILIIIYISTMIDKINNKYNKQIDKKDNKKNNKNKKKNNYNIKTNKSLLVSGIYLISRQIIKGILTKNDLLKINKSFLIKVPIIKDLHNERVSKTPHSKWYVQYYAEHYRYLTIIEALKSNDLSKLNKNLKLLVKNFQIIK